MDAPKGDLASKPALEKVDGDGDSSSGEELSVDLSNPAQAQPDPTQSPSTFFTPSRPSRAKSYSSNSKMKGANNYVVNDGSEGLKSPPGLSTKNQRLVEPMLYTTLPNGSLLGLTPPPLTINSPISLFPKLSDYLTPQSLAGQVLQGPLPQIPTILPAVTSPSFRKVSTPKPKEPKETKVPALPHVNLKKQKKEIPEEEKEEIVDLTPYLNLPQQDAADRLGVPVSTLSKRWNQVGLGRKWPYRTVTKLDKEIMTLMHNIPKGEKMPPAIESELGRLLKLRNDELRPMKIRLSRRSAVAAAKNNVSINEVEQISTIDNNHLMQEEIPLIEAPPDDMEVDGSGIGLNNDQPEPYGDF